MDDERKDNAADGGDGQGSGGAKAGAYANGTSRVPRASVYDAASVRAELGEMLTGIGSKLEELGRTFAETGRLLPEVDGASAAIAVGGIKIELRHVRDLLSHLEINL